MAAGAGTAAGERAPRSERALALPYWLGLVWALGACDEPREMSRQPEFLVQIGTDFTTPGALGSDGSLIVGNNSAGVAYSEHQDAKTGRVVRGARSTSLATARSSPAES